MNEKNFIKKIFMHYLLRWRSNVSGGNKHLKIIGLQVMFLALVGIALFVLYPSADMELYGNRVAFKSINANVIAFSANEDFSNPRYLDFNNVSNLSFELTPGKYYWKASNGIISGRVNEFEILSNVGLEIDRSNVDANLTNIGNVKIKVTKGEGGQMIGHIILGPDESERIEDEGKYIGEQE